MALLFNDIFAVPSKDTPAIVLAVANAVAVAALPAVSASIASVCVLTKVFICSSVATLD